MLKKLFILACLMIPMGLIAQDKIAYVNTNEIMAKLPDLKDVETKMAAKGEALQKSMQAIETEYQTKLEAFNKKLELVQKKDPSVSESEVLDGQKELAQLQERYETHGQSVQAEFQKYQEELLAPIREKIAKAIKEVGAEQNYSYIIDMAALLYVGPSATDANKHVKTKLGITE